MQFTKQIANTAKLHKTEYIKILIHEQHMQLHYIMIHLEDHEYGSRITKRDQLNIITSVSSINIMQCVFMYIVYAFADLRKTTVRCQPGPTVLHINCRLTVNKQDMTSQKFPIHYL